jgi:hypothetical protein
MKADDRTDGRLEEALAALRREETASETPPRVEAALLAAWDSEVRGAHVVTERVHRTPRRRGEKGTQVAALAAGVLLAVTLGRLGQTLREAALPPAAGETASLLLLGEPILVGEMVRVVRMEMPAAALARLGMRTSSVDPTTPITVDVLVGEDGVARAIRF